ncbi:hypothetical protein MRB53_009845 [Persea americana]|uniref:Uncharacterized protein n=1 Tax=Persea americana TaxID=3435 RepID=A0ACC2LQY8_PERAE|nr:hypothetical protein MRB53_009845 [Persea americana]
MRDEEGDDGDLAYDRDLQEWPQRGRKILLLEAGTVLNAKDARKAIQAGAKFLMSPVSVKEILDDPLCSSEVLYIPGVMTPTENHLRSSSVLPPPTNRHLHRCRSRGRKLHSLQSPSLLHKRRAEKNNRKQAVSMTVVIIFLSPSTELRMQQN